MTGTVERNANPRNLFLAISLTILCCAASIGLGMNASRLALVLAGAGFGWMYSFLTFCDPYSHCDFVQNGNAAVAFIVVYALLPAVGAGPICVWAATLAALIAAELINTFITGSAKSEFPVMGTLFTVIAAAAAAMIYFSRGGDTASFAPALAGWAAREPGPVFPAAIALVLAVCGVLLYLAHNTLILHSHGRAYYSPSRAEYAWTKAGLIVGKALVLSVSFALTGIFGGVAYYLITASRGPFSRAVSMAAAVLFALVFSSTSMHAGAEPAVAVSLLASIGLFIWHGKKSRGLR